MSDPISYIKSSGGDVNAAVSDVMNVIAVESSAVGNPLAAIYGMLENKTYTGTNSTIRLSTTIPVSFDREFAIRVKDGYAVNIIYTDGNGNDDPTSFLSGGITVQSGRLLYISLAKKDLTSPIQISEASAMYCDLPGLNAERLDGIDDESVDNFGFQWVIGGYARGSATADGNYDLLIEEENNKTDRIRTINRYPMRRRVHVHTADTSYRIMLVIHNEDMTEYNAMSVLSVAGTPDVTVTVPYGTSIDGLYFMLCIVSTTGDIDSIEDVAKLITVDCKSGTGGSGDDPVSGKQVLIYRFGGEGNDWCFVRTPDGYDPYRAKPYPFVICNHGNGWEMDGSEQFANWTKRTMYVPLTDPDYLDDPTQYNGTSDDSLWYSNPTIEALLDAGYVVCGCENYGDGLYGNEDCRSACAAFFYHMVKTYNVEGRCCMIGASNGAQTSINAAYILGERVKAMILQYPLTCLLNQYDSHPAHQSGIRSAYGITKPDPNEQELIAATATHDFLHTDVLNSVKYGYFPPTKLYYSTEDTVTNYQQNALAMAEVLEDSTKIVETIQASGAHGDASHFDPSAYIAFFDRF